MHYNKISLSYQEFIFTSFMAIKRILMYQSQHPLASSFPQWFTRWLWEATRKDELLSCHCAPRTRIQMQTAVEPGESTEPSWQSSIKLSKCLLTLSKIAAITTSCSSKFLNGDFHCSYALYEFLFLANQNFPPVSADYLQKCVLCGETLFYPLCPIHTHKVLTPFNLSIARICLIVTSV